MSENQLLNRFEEEAKEQGFNPFDERREDVDYFKMAEELLADPYRNISPKMMEI